MANSLVGYYLARIASYRITAIDFAKPEESLQ